MGTILASTRVRGVGSLGLAALFAAIVSSPSMAQSAPGGAAAPPARPSSPVSLNIIDGGGKVAVEMAIKNFVAANPGIVSSVRWESASEGDIAAVLKPQVDSGNLKVDLVITGSAGLSAGLENKLWLPIATDYPDRLSNMKHYIKPAQELQALTKGYGVTVVWCYCGPTIEYNAEVVGANPPKTTADLLQWVSKHPGKFGYARPANSGVGRTFLLALPYMLGDKDPDDPEHGWDKTWAYLEQLGKYIDNYPTRTSQSMEYLASGRWTLMPSSAGWDVGPRGRGQVPAEMSGYALQNTTWVMDPNYALVPRGVSKEKLSALLLLINYIISAEGNATVGTGGQYIPGIVVDNVKDDMIPAATRELLAKFSRPWFKDDFAASKSIPPPKDSVVVKALDIWDRRIGARR